VYDIIHTMNEKPKILYHGSGIKITDGFIRAKPGHINGMKTEVVAVFAKSDYTEAMVYAIMRKVGYWWRSPRGNELYVDSLNPDISGKGYIYELDSDGFISDAVTNKNDYYCLTDKPIIKETEFDIMDKIKNGEIKVYILKDKIDFSKMSKRDSTILWRELVNQKDNFELYKPDVKNIDMAILTKTLENGSKAL